MSSTRLSSCAEQAHSAGEYRSYRWGRPSSGLIGYCLRQIPRQKKVKGSATHPRKLSSKFADTLKHVVSNCRCEKGSGPGVRLLPRASCFLSSVHKFTASAAKVATSGTSRSGFPLAARTAPTPGRADLLFTHTVLMPSDWAGMTS